MAQTGWMQKGWGQQGWVREGFPGARTLVCIDLIFRTNPKLIELIFEKFPRK